MRICVFFSYFNNLGAERVISEIILILLVFFYEKDYIYIRFVGEINVTIVFFFNWQIE
jgi:hypothetical protein